MLVEGSFYNSNVCGWVKCNHIQTTLTINYCVTKLIYFSYISANQKKNYDNNQNLQQIYRNKRTKFTKPRNNTLALHNRRVHSKLVNYHRNSF